MKRSDLAPEAPQLIDAGFIIALSMLGLAGFSSAFGGWTYLTAAAVGVALGVFVALVITQLRLPGLVSLAIALVVFVAFGAVVAARDETIAGIVPTPEAVSGLVDGMVSGWRRLLTSLPPSGSLGNLLAVPYLIGFVVAIVSQLLARRRQLAGILVVPTSGALGLSILFGTREPFSLLLQGAAFGATALGWLSVRAGREHRRIVQSSGRRRLVAAAAMLVIIGGSGLVVGPHLPFAEASDRVVLRTDPPFDARQYASPLNAFQKYLIGDLEDEVMFTVAGMPSVVGEQRVRLAAMDDYDGVVWRVGSGSSPGAADFIRVGSSVPVDATGQSVELKVTIDQLPGIWMPSLGTVTGVRWSGTTERSRRLHDQFRLSLQANTGAVAVTGGWVTGDAYDESGVITSEPLPAALQDATVDTSVRLDLTRGLPDELAALAASITKGKATPYEQALALQDWLRKGYYKRGDELPGEGTSNPPGHSIARLISFVKNDVPVGNAEQYAATMALFARSLGLPARVVMGFKVQPGATEVRGSDVDAWVEIAFAGQGWVTFIPTPYDNTSEPNRTTQKKRPQFESSELPPPPIAPPTPEEPLTQEGRKKPLPAPPKPKQEGPAPQHHSHRTLYLALAGAPAVVVMAPLLAVLFLKRRRRARRRRRGDPTVQIAGGWQELIDLARDARLDLPTRSTRRDAARALGTPQVVELASSADEAIFGPGHPTPEHVSLFWRNASEARREILRPLSRWRRLRAAASIASLRAAR